jgi:hypothetical protein
MILIGSYLILMVDSPDLDYPVIDLDWRGNWQPFNARLPLVIGAKTGSRDVRPHPEAG